MDIVGHLERVDIFSGLTQEELNSIAELCQPRKYGVNEVIFAEKSKGKEMYVVTKGRVRIELGIKGKTDCATVHRVGEGEVFGELVVVNEQRRSATAISESHCEVIAIGREAFTDLFDKSSRIGYVIMKNLASLLATRLRKTNLQLIACFLWE